MPSHKQSKACEYRPGQLVWIAGELLVPQPAPASAIASTLFAHAQLALVVAKQKCLYTSERYLEVWFSEFGVNKKGARDCTRSLGKPTTRIWLAC